MIELDKSIEKLKTQNPFYFNYVFHKEDTKRDPVNQWKFPLLWFVPKMVQLNDGYIFYFKRLGNRYFYLDSVYMGKNI